MPRVNLMSYIFSTNWDQAQDKGPRQHAKGTDMSLSLRIPGSLGEADPGTEALSRVPKEHGARRLWDHRQGALGPEKVPERLVEEVTSELRLQGVKEKQEGIPGRGGSLSKKKKKEKKVCALAGPAQELQANAKQVKQGWKGQQSFTGHRRSMGGYRVESDLL